MYVGVKIGAMDETKQQKGYGKRPLWQWVVIYIIIAGIIYAGIYYLFLAKKGGYNYNQNQSGQYRTQPINTSSTQTTQLSGTQEITIEGNEFSFTPSTITIKQGQAVKITFKNMGKYPHNFTISDLNVQTKTIQPGEQDSIQLTPSKTGSFFYICTVGSHADRGMRGTLTVQ